MEGLDVSRNGVCHARRTNGQPCRKAAIRGGTVCYTHGGASRQVREKAAMYLISQAYPAARKMAELINHRNGMIALAASKDILDRTGHKAIERIEQDGRMIVEIEFVDRGRVVEHDA